MLLLLHVCSPDVLHQPNAASAVVLAKVRLPDIRMAVGHAASS